MDHMENPMYHISESLKLLEIHRDEYLGGVGGSILLEHFMSLEHGLKFLELFLKFSPNMDLRQRIGYSASYVKQKLESLTCIGNDERLAMNLEHEYVHLREEMKNVIIKPGTNEYYVIFPENITALYAYFLTSTSMFLCDEVKKLLASDYKADQITPITQELEGIVMILIMILENYAKSPNPVGSLLTVNEERRKASTAITSTLDRAACFIYLSFIGKIDDSLAISLKNGLSDLIIKEAGLTKMYGILHMRKKKSPIDMSLRLLKWNTNRYLGTEKGEAFQDHFMSIKHGVQFLFEILEILKNKDLKRRIQDLLDNVRRKLLPLSFPRGQIDENQIMKLDAACGELREEMQNVFIKPGTNDYDTLFPEILREKHCFTRTKNMLLYKIRKLVTLSCKANQIAPMMKELEKLGKKMTSLKPLFDYIMLVPDPFSLKEEEEKIFAALTHFLDRATNLLYLLFVGKFNEDMLVSVRKNVSLLLEETEIKDVSLNLGIILEDELEFHIDISLALLKRHEEYYTGKINGAMLKDHIMSLKHGIEFIKWIHKYYIDRSRGGEILSIEQLKDHIMSLLVCEQGGESLSMNVNRAYGDLRKEMENVIIKLAYANDSRPIISYVRGINDFLVEKITTLLTSNCKADKIGPLKKELQNLRKMLRYLKPLDLYVSYNLPSFVHGSNNFTTLLTTYPNATFLIYLIFVAKMETTMENFVKSRIAQAIMGTNLHKMYSVILNEFWSDSDYLEDELYPLENLISLLKSNVESLNDANSRLYGSLIDMRSFLLGLSPNVLLRKLHLLQPSFQAILDHSIPIICSCYHEPTEVDILAKLDCVLDLIKHIKCEVQEIKLYYFPRTDDLGFMEFFSGYLEELMKNREMLIIKEIGALHFEIHSLLSLDKVTSQVFNVTPWTDIINMAYQAEYIIDLYLASTSGDTVLISCLRKIIEQLKKTRGDVHGSPSLRAQHVLAVTSIPQDLSMTTRVIGSDEIVGMQEEIKSVKEYLLKSVKKLDVISIFGMAGVGKTTLASTIYESPSMAGHFDILARCKISQSYQKRALLLTILGQVNASDNRSELDDEELAAHLCRSLRKCRYLIVLDDVWDTTLWDYLKRYLPDDKNGSRILITTRNGDVAKKMANEVKELHLLSDERSWELFQKRMSGIESLSEEILKISKRIVEHCKGLPLSIIIIVGILKDLERTNEKWNQIEESLNSVILSDPQGKCKAILEQSYNHLPNHLRSCFLYLGSFPEGQEIRVNRLIVLWIAEGLIRDTDSESLEEVSKKYVEVLTVKNLVMRSAERSRGGVQTLSLHDLLRDFCLEKAKEQRFLTLLDTRNYSRPLEDPRRLIINSTPIDDLNLSYHSVRSMICYDLLETSEIAKRIEFCDMVLLKVLEVGKVYSESLPNISRLVHLRYLALTLMDRKISILPSSITKLQNLRILILGFVFMIKVPDSIWDMVKLRHVHISPSFKVDADGLENSPFLLENLRSLSRVWVSCGDSKWLKKLLGLQRLSCIFMAEEHNDDGGDDEEDDDREEDKEDGEDDDLESNQFGVLNFNGNLTSLKVGNEAGSKQRFRSICPLPSSLRKLTLSGFFLTSNDISKIGKTTPNLEVFKIYSCSVRSGYEWNVDDGDFPEVKILKLRNLPISTWTASEDSFPKLEELWVENCDYLDEIPLDFESLSELRLITVKGCAPSVDNSARNIEEQQHEYENRAMRVRIYPKK